MIHDAWTMENGRLILWLDDTLMNIHKQNIYVTVASN